MKKRIFTVAVATGMLLASAVSSFAATETTTTDAASTAGTPIVKDFKDLTGYGWAKTNITSLVGIGAIAGYPDGTFKPGNTITAAEFAKIAVGLVATQEEVAATETTENPHHWASHHMAYAYSHQMIPEGMFGTADWDKAVSRQKMAVIMENTAEYVLNEETVTDSTKLGVVKSRFSDYANICDKCKDKVVQAYCRGLIGGYADGTFGPVKNSTRAEAATMLIRLINSNERLVVDYTVKSPADTMESHVTATYPLGQRGDLFTKFEGVSYLTSGADVKVYDSAKACGLKLISAEPGKVVVQSPKFGTVVALDKNGKRIALGDAFLAGIDGKNTLKCNLEDIAYFGTAVETSVNSTTYGVCVNDLK